MAKYKTKMKDHKLIVTVKLSMKEKLEEIELEYFYLKPIRGFFEAKVLHKGTIEYFGRAEDVTLYERLEKPISKHDFFMIIEQVVVAVQNIQNNKQLTTDSIVSDVKRVFVNRNTNEILFIYLPVKQVQMGNTLVGFVEDIIYSAKLIEEKDKDYISRFTHFFKGLQSFDADAIERFIQNEDSSVVSMFKHNDSGHKSGSRSGGQTSSYSGNSNDTVPFYEKERRGGETEPFYDYNIENEDEERGIELLRDDDRNEYEDGHWTMPFRNNGSSNRYDNGKNTTKLRDDGRDHGEYDRGKNTTKLQKDNVDHDGYGNRNGTEKLQKDRYGNKNGTTRLQHDDAVHEYEDGNGTTPLSGDDSIGRKSANERIYAKLYRVKTGEVIIINKVFFRIGSERGDADYVVSDNNTVSRNHANIIIKGGSFFIEDLNSLNHTYINGKVILAREEMEIYNGDRIQLSNEEFEFQV